MVLYYRPPNFSCNITAVDAFKTNRRCWFCGTDAYTKKDPATLEHLLPKSRCGKDDDENLVIACRSCNADKGALTVNEYREVIQCQQMLFNMRLGIMPRVKEVKFYGETCNRNAKSFRPNWKALWPFNGSEPNWSRSAPTCSVGVYV